MKTRSYRACLTCATSLVLAGIGVQAATATPFVRRATWPADKKIEVFIQNIDPEGANSRQQLIADGINRWQATLDRGYTINVHLGDPPDPAPANLVRFTWQAPGTAKWGLTLDGNDGIAGCNWNADGTITRGNGILDNTLPAATADQRAYIRNLGMHEFTHILGLADDPLGVVTDHTVQAAGVMAFNARDLAEITDLYGRPPAAGGGAPRGRAQLGGGGGGTGFFEYQFDFEGLSDEHISVITLDVDPSLVNDVIPPSGWLFMDPNEVALLGPDAPFFDGYMEDGFIDPPPWELLDYLSFRASDPMYELTTSNPKLTLTLLTDLNVPVGDISVWSGGGVGGVQWVQGPVPEPGTLSLLGLGGMLLLRRRRR